MAEASRPQVVDSVLGTSCGCVRCGPVTRRGWPGPTRTWASSRRIRRFFTVMPELPEATLKAAVEVDHEDHEALVAVPLLSFEMVMPVRPPRRPTRYRRRGGDGD